MIGEELAPSLLREAGFTVITSLPGNHPDADFLASKDGRRYLISVKARNKWTNTGELNPRYKLHSKLRSTEKALATARDYGAEYAWLAIQIDRRTYSAFFGTHAQLLNAQEMGRKLNGTGIPMGERYLSRYQRLAGDHTHEYDYDDISNQPV